MWKAAWLWLKSPRASNLHLSKTTSGTSRPAVHSPGRGETCINHQHSSISQKVILKKPFCAAVRPWLQFLFSPCSSLTCPGFLTFRLCQGLEWMMSRLRVRWCPPRHGSRGCPRRVRFFCSKHKLELRDWLVAPVLIPADMDGALPGFYISEYDNLFWSFWTQNQTIGDFRMTLDYRASRCCCTVSLSAKQRAAKCLAWNEDDDSSCVSPQWPCSIAWLAVTVFMALSVYTAQYLTWCLQQNVQVGIDGDRNMQKGG